MTAGLSVAFLDRDGTLNVKAREGEYVECPEELELLPGAAAAVRRLNDIAVKTVVVTNQRAVALGRLSSESLARIHERLRQLLREATGAELDLILHCAHSNGECRCRKPLPGLLEEAERRLGPVDRTTSVMIGDAASDVQAGRAFGVLAIQVGHDVPDISAAAEIFVRRLERTAG